MRGSQMKTLGLSLTFVSALLLLILIFLSNLGPSPRPALDSSSFSSYCQNPIGFVFPTKSRLSIPMEEI